MALMGNCVGSGPDVLIASADESTVEFLSVLLAEWGYRIESVAGGQEALGCLDGPHPPFVALLDIELSSGGGMEAIRWITRNRERRKSWLVLMTHSRVGDTVRRLAVESGCDDLLVLPADPLRLRIQMRVAERVHALMGQMQRQSAEMRYQATHDGLTGLWNREALLSLIFQETDRVQRMKTSLSLLLLDLDSFSAVNHEYGYQAGDKVLTGLASRFRRQMRSYDLIGRTGEDEFLLALPGCSSEAAVLLAERMREMILGRPFALGAEATTLQASFGIASSGGRSPLVVLREAEAALAEAKVAGKNCIRCYPSPESSGIESLLRDLRVG